METTIEKILEENKLRRASLSESYNPATGLGSPIPRTQVSYFYNNVHYTHYYPTEMVEDNPAIQLLNETGSPEKAFETTDQLVIETILKEIIEIRFDYDFEFWVFTCVKIQDKETKKEIPFVLNKGQRKLLLMLEKMRMSGIPIRVILLKARQWGGSTLVQVYMAWIQVRLKENWHSAVVADVEDQSRNIRGMYRRLARNYPKHFGSITFVPYEGSSKNKVMVERNCIIGVGSAQEPDSLRSFDFAMLHLSEVGLWKSTPMKSAEDLAQSIRSTVPSIPYSMIVMESNAKGSGNFFHREWQAATSRKSSYEPVFVAWFAIERYQKEIPPEYFQSFAKWVIGEPYARILWEKGATLEGIKWYFDTRAGENYDEWRMKSEYPSDDIEAFQGTGRRVYSAEYVKKAEAGVREPDFIGELCADSLGGPESLKNINFEQNSRGSLYIWTMPDYNERVNDRYALFADVGGRTPDSDYSCISVIDRYWMMEGGVPEIVATWWGHLDQDLFAWKAAQLAMFYCNGLLAIETNSLRTLKATEGDHFITILDEIVAHYRNLYARTEPEKIKQKAPIKWGFHTNSGTKSLIINTHNAALRDGLYVERDKRAISEMNTLEYKLDGSIGAVDGCHDDIVITRAGVVWMALKYMPPPTPFKPFSNKEKSIQSEATF